MGCQYTKLFPNKQAFREQKTTRQSHFHLPREAADNLDKITYTDFHILAIGKDLYYPEIPTMSILRFLFVSSIVFVVLITSGCGPVNYPMATSLGDLRSERRISESDEFYFQEIITLDGSNPTQLVGRPIHYGQPYIGLPSRVIGFGLSLVFPLWAEGDLNPSTAFPLEHVNEKSERKNDTYRRIGWCKSPGSKTVRSIARKIDEVQIHALELVELRLQLAQAKVRNSPAADITALRQKIDTKRNEIRTARGAIHDLLVGTNVHNVNVPNAVDEDAGVIIVRWSTAQEGGASADAGSAFGQVNVYAAKRKSGYVVLGGIEIAQLVIGEDLLNDLSAAFNNKDEFTSDSIRKLLKQSKLGLTTYTLKSKDIAYSSDLQAEVSAYLKAVISKANLSGATSFDTLTIEAEYAQAADLSNIGALPALTWKTEQYIFGKRLLNANESVSSGTASLQALTPEPAGAAGTPIEGWSTIYSVVAIPKPATLKYLSNKGTKANGNGSGDSSGRKQTNGPQQNDDPAPAGNNQTK